MGCGGFRNTVRNSESILIAPESHLLREWAITLWDSIIQNPTTIECTVIDHSKLN
jgi:hypothetical protein